MKKAFLPLSILMLSFTVLTSCSNDDNGSSSSKLEVPSTYTFERNGATTIDFSGQTARLKMLDQLGAQFTTAATDGTVLDAIALGNMFSNTNNPFTDNELNASGKNLKSKTASSSDYFTLFLGGGSTTEKIDTQAFFEMQFANGATASEGNTAASGVAGVYLDGSKKRLIAANGLEPQQVVLKGLMGACMMDQISNHYLSLNVLDASTNVIDNTNKIVATDANFTTMEHYWDEAYGYIYGADDNSVSPAKLKFWSSYIEQVNADADFNTVSANINLAFRKGRAAIVANDYNTRDAQIEVIQENLALVAAVRAVFYMQEGKAKLVEDGGAKAFHALSEGYGFIMALRYTREPGTENPYFSKQEVDAMLASLTSGTNGLWDIDTLSPKLDAISLQIATKFGFTVEQASVAN